MDITLTVMVFQMHVPDGIILCYYEGCGLGTVDWAGDLRERSAVIMKS